jgi:hypothetical protein
MKYRLFNMFLKLPLLPGTTFKKDLTNLMLMQSKLNKAFLCLLPLSLGFFASFVLGPKRWRHVSPNCRYTFNGIHGVIYQEIKLFITTAVRISNPINFSSFFVFLPSCCYLQEGIHDCLLNTQIWKLTDTFLFVSLPIFQKLHSLRRKYAGDRIFISFSLEIFLTFSRR